MKLTKQAHNDNTLRYLILFGLLGPDFSQVGKKHLG